MYNVYSSNNNFLSWESIELLDWFVLFYLFVSIILIYLILH